jgi:hypothetical protein
MNSIGATKMVIDGEKVLWILNSLLIIALGFFMKSWINSVEKRLEKKLDAALCDERNERHCLEIDKMQKHKHASTGEVILP